MKKGRWGFPSVAQLPPKPRLEPPFNSWICPCHDLAFPVNSQNDSPSWIFVFGINITNEVDLAFGIESEGLYYPWKAEGWMASIMRGCSGSKIQLGRIPISTQLMPLSSKKLVRALAVREVVVVDAQFCIILFTTDRRRPWNGEGELHEFGLVIVEEVVKKVTEDALKEWINANIDKVVKQSIKEKLESIAKKKL